MFFIRSAAPTPAPDLAIAYNTSSTSLVVKWSHVPKQYVRGEPFGYIIYYASLLDSVVHSATVNFMTNTTTLRKLYVYTYYVITIAAVSSGGEGYMKQTSAVTGENRLLFLSC